MKIKLQIFSMQILNSRYNAYYLVILRVLISILTVYLLNNEIIFCMNNNNTDAIFDLFGTNPQNQTSTYIQQLELRCNQLENQVKNFHSLYDISQRKLNQLQEDYNLLFQKYNQLTHINKQLQTENFQQKQHLLWSNNETLKDVIQVQQTEIEMLKHHCRMLEGQNSVLKNQISHLEQKNTELERQLNSNFFLF